MQAIKVCTRCGQRCDSQVCECTIECLEEDMGER